MTRLESGELPLEDALNEFERGVQLARQGQQKLQQAEQRVQILLTTAPTMRRWRLSHRMPSNRHV